jgi:hypothetical protein
MKALLPDALIVSGALLVPASVAMVHVPAAVAVLGLECIVLGWLTSRVSGRR